MGIVRGNFIFSCDNDRGILNFPADKSAFELVESHEREMGNENVYIWEHEFLCDCLEVIKFKYEFCEYPNGVFNSHSVEIEGGTAIELYTYDFSDIL